MEVTIVISAKFYPTQCTPVVYEAANFQAHADAKIIYNAVEHYEVNENAIIIILTKREFNQRQKILKEYRILYESDLLEVLKSKLSGDFANAVLSLMMPLPNFYAKELNDAIKGIGTDESAIIEILCTLSNYGIRTIAECYQKMYGTSLEEDLIGDTSGYFRKFCVSMAKGIRDEHERVDEVLAKKDAKALCEAAAGEWGTEESVFHKILTSRSYQHLHRVFLEYEAIVGHDIEKAIEQHFSGDIREAFLALVQCLKSRVGFFAERLYKSMKGLGTDEKTLTRIIVGRSEIDLGDIKVTFKQVYGKSLESWIEDDTSGGYKKVLLGICG